MLSGWSSFMFFHFSTSPACSILSAAKTLPLSCWIYLYPSRRDLLWVCLLYYYCVLFSGAKLSEDCWFCLLCMLRWCVGVASTLSLGYYWLYASLLWVLLKALFLRVAFGCWRSLRCWTPWEWLEDVKFLLYTAWFC
jgi:hypothetical protein